MYQTRKDFTTTNYEVLEQVKQGEQQAAPYQENNYMMQNNMWSDEVLLNDQWNQQTNQYIQTPYQQYPQQQFPNQTPACKNDFEINQIPQNFQNTFIPQYEDPSLIQQTKMQAMTTTYQINQTYIENFTQPQSRKQQQQQQYVDNIQRSQQQVQQEDLQTHQEFQQQQSNTQIDDNYEYVMQQKDEQTSYLDESQNINDNIQQQQQQLNQEEKQEDKQDQDQDQQLDNAADEEKYPDNQPDNFDFLGWFNERLKQNPDENYNYNSNFQQYLEFNKLLDDRIDDNYENYQEQLQQEFVNQQQQLQKAFLNEINQIEQDFENQQKSSDEKLQGQVEKEEEEQEEQLEEVQMQIPQNNIFDKYVVQAAQFHNKCQQLDSSKLFKPKMNDTLQCIRSHFIDDNLNNLPVLNEVKILTRKHDKKNTASSSCQNMKKLVMNGILKFLQPQILNKISSIPEPVRNEIIKIAQYLRQSGKVEEKNKTVKMDQFSQTHFNILFLSLNRASCRCMAKNEQNYYMHQNIFNIDINNFKNIDQSRLEYINLIKMFIYLLIKEFFEKTSLEDNETVKGYKERVLVSIKKMIEGQHIKKFQIYSSDRPNNNKKQAQ